MHLVACIWHKERFSLSLSSLQYHLFNSDFYWTVLCLWVFFEFAEAKMEEAGSSTRRRGRKAKGPFLDGKKIGLPDGWYYEQRPRTSVKYIGKIDQVVSSFDFFWSIWLFIALKVVIKNKILLCMLFILLGLWWEIWASFIYGSYIYSGYILDYSLVKWQSSRYPPNYCKLQITVFLFKM